MNKYNGITMGAGITLASFLIPISSVLSRVVRSRVMRKYNSVTYEVGKAKAEQAAGMFGLAARQRADSCPSRVAKPLAKPLTGGWRSATYARSQQSAPCFSRSICSSDFILMYIETVWGWAISFKCTGYPPTDCKSACSRIKSPMANGLTGACYGCARATLSTIQMLRRGLWKP